MSSAVTPPAGREISRSLFRTSKRKRQGRHPASAAPIRSSEESRIRP